MKSGKQQKRSDTLIPFRFSYAHGPEQSSSCGVITCKTEQLISANRNKTGNGETRKGRFTFACPARTELFGDPGTNQPSFGRKSTTNCDVTQSRKTNSRKTIQFDEYVR